MHCHLIATKPWSIPMLIEYVDLSVMSVSFRQNTNISQNTMNLKNSSPKWRPICVEFNVPSFSARGLWWVDLKSVQWVAIRKKQQEIRTIIIITLVEMARMDHDTLA